MKRPVTTRLPLLRRWAIRRLMRRRFPVEMALLAGNPPAASDAPSTVLFTMHKCASIYVGNLLAECARDSGLHPVNWDFFAFDSPLTSDERHRLFEAGDESLYPTRGFLFAPFRFPNAGIPKINLFRVIVMTRDPRDILTSLYYSIAHSHGFPLLNEAETLRMKQRREETQQMSIDEFALRESPDLRASFEAYTKHLLGKEFALFSTYEEMIQDFEPWLRRLVEHMRIPVKESVIERLVSEADFTVQGENMNSHRRQVTPGDHRRKLEPETIEQLNAIFGDVMEKVGHPL